VFSKAREEIPRVVILGGEDSPGVITQLKASKKLSVVPGASDWKAQISDKKIRGAVELPAGFEA
jgi:sodium transport system permease protein